MPSVALNDIDHMREAVFFDGPDVRRKLSRFWILLILASVIADGGCRRRLDGHRHRRHDRGAADDPDPRHHARGRAR